MAQDPATSGRQVEIVRLDFKGTEVDDYPEFLGYLDPFARRLMNRTDVLAMLGAYDHAKLEEYAATLSKTSRAMAEQATERMQATVHGGENLFAKMLLASCAYFIEFKAWPHPGTEWKIQGHVFKADPQDWNSIRRWTQAIFVLAGVR